MIEAQNASFKFGKFKIPSFSFNESKGSNSDLKIAFKPSGLYNQATGEFELTIEFIGSENNVAEKNVVTVTSIATFVFPENTPYANLPDYFFKNSIAILFPYLRAFISNLTMQSNTGILTLSIMNLGRLEQPLRDNTKVVTAVKVPQKIKKSK